MSTYNRELSYDQEIETVKGIKFSVLSPEEITRRSVVEVTKNDTFSGSDPIVGGLFDPRMGVLETNRTCSTCQQKNLFCPGHFGHIVLARPIYNPMFFDVVRKLLKCVCCRCSRPLVSQRSTREDIRNEIQRIGSIVNLHKRWDALMKLHTKIKLKRCGDDHDKNDEENSGCQAVQPSRYQKESSGLKIIAEWKSGLEGQADGTTQCEFTAEDILRIFKRITEDDLKLMGFDPRWNKPEWMICTVLPVPPPSVRPSIIEDSGQRREDDLTHKLCDIIKYNNQLKQKLESGKANEENIKVLANLVQYHVATFIDNQIPGMPVAQQRNGRKLKSIADRLKKKEGRIRGNLNGKRVDQSARSVITPDPYISLDELGVPLRIAMNLTFPEVVNRFNIVQLRELVQNGVDEWPGAKYVRRSSNGITISLKYADRDEVAANLQIGDTVDRHMMDGDYVLFNRQPSLHKMSMMGFKIRVMQYQTFRLPVLSTGCFNADFDGDEMNLFNPQNVQTMSEIMDITAIPFLVLNPRDGKPIVEVIQDTMVGSFRMTNDWTTLSDKTMANLQMVNSYFDGALPPPNPESNMYTGKQAFSEMLPPGLFISMTNKAGKKFVIENSMITSGTVDKSVFHSMSKGIIPVLYHDYSPFEVRRFLDNTQRLMCRWLTIGGFSVGISDIIVGPEMNEYIRRTINENKKKAYEKFQDIRKGTFDNSSIFSNEENFEREMRDVLNAMNKELGRVKLDEQSNRMINMIKSGSKGKEENVAQMVAAVGQQNVDGKRVSYGFTDRTLPHYTKYDDGPESRGFVENSFISGLTPQEVFFHAMGGREGLIDTAVRSVTGDTPIVIMEDGQPKYVKIGDWIDARLEKESESIMHFTERQMEYLKLNNKVFIPTGDEDGTVTWGEVTAMTRHDPGTELYEIKTYSGRSVIVTESKSLIVWDEDTKKFKSKPTPEVQIGEYVPVTARLGAPPVITTKVDMAQYFPKTEYIHGTEFHKAERAMKEAMTGRLKIPAGWWERNNGTTFILPYPDKAKLQRALSGRSNTENIKDGSIHPYSANRTCGLIPAELELNYDNGVFIGIYLADGTTCPQSGHVAITKKEESIKAFVKKWFDKYQIKSVEKTFKNQLGSYTEVIANSSLLARFLDAFVGHGARNKYVPDVAFTAPEEFITGLLSGYFSGDGSINEQGKSVMVSSVSRRLIEGVSFLCSRMGIFGKLSTYQQKTTILPWTKVEDIAPIYRFDIRAQWATQFANCIDLIHDEKQANLQNIITDNVHRNFQTSNDVVLDAIKEINIIDVANYPKVYDLTVPSTLNFTLGNGMVVYDTSETGYIQRRLVKAMEDAKVYYDQTVRNATGALVQYLYGEDGMDGTKIEKQFIPYISMNVIEMDNLYHLRPEDPLHMFLTEKAFKSLGPPGGWYKRCKAHFDALLVDRRFLIEEVFRGKKEDKIQYPIPFERIINNAVKRLGDAARAPTDLTPVYILDKITDLISRLKVIRENQGIRFLHILLRIHLSPKVILMKHNMSQAIFDWVADEIERKFIEAVVHPGEMVGVIAAQSIGELGTQQSVTKDTQIKIAGSKPFSGEIGTFIDTLLADNAAGVVDLGHGSMVLDLEKDYYIVGISTTEKTAWQRISQISRHPANGQLMKVITRSGRSVTATMSHSFLKRGPTGIIPVVGADLRIGNRIPVAKRVPGFTTTAAEFIIISGHDDIVPEIGTAVPILPDTDMPRSRLAAYIDLVSDSEKSLLTQAVNADAVYDEIVEIEYIPDNGEYVYDFTVPGNDSFMVNAGILVHNTLDSFHSSGTVAAVKATSGVSRLKELLNVSKNIKTPTMFIYMKPDIGTIVNPIEKDETGREVSDPRILEAKKKSIRVKMQLEMARIADILDSTEIYWDPPGADGLTTGLEKDNQILEVYRAFAMVDDQQRCRSTSPWVLRININKEKLFKIGLTMIDIYTRLIMAYNQQIDCVFSDDNADDLVFIVRLMTDALKDVDKEDTVAALKAMEYNLVNSVLLKGTKGIKKVAMRPVTTDMFNSETDQFDSITEWILDTDGTNLQEILANPNIDSTRTRSNDVCEIMNVLGIEAARNVLHHEFTEVVGSDALNYRHMSMLLDTMTNRGTIMSVDRHGINRGDIGPLAKSSFEETTDMLVEASIFSQHDHINGVSANIMLGQVPPCGTGDPNIYIDEKEYVRLAKRYAPAAEVPEPGHEYVTEVPDINFAESCSSSALAFTFNAPQNPGHQNFIQLPKIVFK